MKEIEVSGECFSLISFELHNQQSLSAHSKKNAGETYQNIHCTLYVMLQSTFICFCRYMLNINNNKNVFILGG